MLGAMGAGGGFHLVGDAGGSPLGGHCARVTTLDRKSRAGSQEILVLCPETFPWLRNGLSEQRSLGRARGLAGAMRVVVGTGG